MPLRFRSIWISDTHLGGKNLKSNQLFEFLQKTESEFLYLVGDIFDLWKLRRNWHWPAVNDAIIALILEKAKNGTRVIYLPGNHDEQLAKFAGSSFNGIEIHKEIIHESVDGRQFLVLHGDQFDCVVQNTTWLANIGSFLYDALLDLNRYYNKYRRLRGKRYYSISSAIKQRCKSAVNYIGNFEHILADEIRRQNVDGIICGHIHHASIKTIENFIYTNSGDWVESCTALAENHNGTLGIIEWAEQTPVIELGQKVREHDKNRYRDRCLAPTN
jgi:UDP-2,3-diacylglucosamine pyrophosphatase LpxH